jgi:hypothetical protein
MQVEYFPSRQICSVMPVGPVLVTNLPGGQAVAAFAGVKQNKTIPATRNRMTIKASSEVARTAKLHETKLGH